MIRIDVTPRASDIGPRCAHCSAPTRLVGIEPHPTTVKTDLRTYQCLACERVQAEVVPLTP
jgi:hypothetical protein